MRLGSSEVFRLRRRSVAARAGVVAAVIGVLALASLPGAGAASSTSRSVTATASRSATTTVSASSSSTASAEGDTKCVPWGQGGLGLKCTGTYSGNTAFDPWTPTQSGLPASDQPWVTVSQVKDLTDQDVQVTWHDFTPSFSNAPQDGFAPDTTGSDIYQVSLFECNGTSPDWSDGYNKDCYITRTVGSNSTVNLTQGPPNAEVESTLDTSVPPNVPGGNLVASPYSPVWGWAPFYAKVPIDQSGYTVPCGSSNPCSFNGGNPATWTGQADFHVEAPTPRAQGGFFNCGPSTPCSLVIDPNWGGTPSSESYTNTSANGCNTHTWGSGSATGDFASPNPETISYGESQEPASGGNGADNPAQVGQNNWGCWTQDRIVIPLSFAPTSQDCPNTTPQFYAAGSPMMETQMLQWMAGWCTGQAPVSVSYNFEVSETTARDEFLAGAQAATGRTDMALVTLPPDAAAQQASSRKFTYAPLANSGTGIAYEVDDGATGSQIDRMVLNARLLAKLTTQSYTLQYGVCTGHSPPQPGPYCDPAVLNNPYSVFDDPEFLSLNTNCQPYGWQSGNYVCGAHSAVDNPNDTHPGPIPDQIIAASSDFPPDGIQDDGVGYGGFLPTALGSDSDMTYDMTDWIASDQDAAGFLNGETDPWGMHVNNNYLHVPYPVPLFSVLDNGWTNPDATCSGNQSCSHALITDESMQASWNFPPDLDTIVQDLLSGQPTSDSNILSCPATYANNGGCNSITQLSVGGLPVEFIGNRALLSELDLGDIANYQFPAAELVNAAGKAVGPTQASVEAAVKDMETNPDGITQYVNYSSKDPSAYPLAMVDYAMVPTCGLSHTEASAIADFLTKVATTGQSQGEAPGDLAPGYYPLTAKQKAQTLAAAAEVKAQDCKSAPPDKTVGGRSAPNDTTPSRATSSQPGSTAPASGKKAPSSAATPSRGAGAGTPKAQTAAFGQKSADSGLAGLLLLLAIIVGALLLIGGPAAWAITATGKWPVVLRWLRPVQARLRPALAWLTGLVVRRA
jgi:hypothetical protein